MLAQSPFAGPSPRPNRARSSALHTISTPPATPGRDTVRSFGILSTFPPTSCGIATFSAALAAALIGHDMSVDVVRCGPAPELEDPLVLASLADDGERKALDVLNRTDIVIVQHEYGIFSGLDGESVVGLMDGIDVPIVVVAHTVVSAPTANQRLVLERICSRADVVVVMTETARARLATGFDVDGAKVVVIPHGATTPVAGESVPGDDPWSGAGQRILTWGLLGPGKGIEWAIDAMDAVADVQPSPQYIIAGATHPKVRERSGESYREMLVGRAAASSANISFDDSYRDLPSLIDLIRSADLVVLPYDSKEQVTSGVLVDAVAAGRPVVSTAFPHAVELLSSGAGIVVPQGDPAALGAAIRTVVTDPALAASMAAEATRLAPDLAWGAVALRYIGLTDDLISQQRGSVARRVTT
jgi:glycosyltransferase involved in cell wall biosynthesis